MPPGPPRHQFSILNSQFLIPDLPRRHFRVGGGKFKIENSSLEGQGWKFLIPNS
jgi:hypothetical protein